MNHYIMIRRLRFPSILLLIGGVALLHQTGVIDHFWHWFFPLLLILLGVLMLAERAALAAGGGYPPMPYPGAPYQAAPDFRATSNIPTYPGQAEAYIPPQHTQEPGKDPEGGRS
jgi:hypothetical protein